MTSPNSSRRTPEDAAMTRNDDDTKSSVATAAVAHQRNENCTKKEHSFVVSHEARKPIVVQTICKVLNAELSKNDEESIVNALTTLANLCYGHNKDKASQRCNRKAVCQCNGHTVVLRVMQKWQFSYGVQSAGCRAIQHMLLENGVPPSVFVRNGGFEVVLNAMNRFKTSKLVQGHGCGALANLVFHATSVERFFQLNGLDSLMHAMRSFPKSRGLMLHGSWVLCKLSQCRAYNSRIVSAGALTLLAKTMEEHQAEKCIFDRAKFAMTHLLKLMPEIIA